MSTTSTAITVIISAVLIVALGYAVVKGVWSAAKTITVPIQIALFVVMSVCVGRLFCTKENARKLYDGIEQTGISQNVENTMRSALKLKPVTAHKVEEKSESVSAAPAVSEPVTSPVVSRIPSPVPKPEPSKASTVVKTTTKTDEAPAAVNVEVKGAQFPQPAVATDPAPAKVPDYSHLNKGKKSFAYALPFNAKVTVGFKGNTYRVIVESLGSLDASEKKEIGKMIFMALGEYIGKKIDSWNKSKISIESRYDESDNQTHVFAIIPPDAID